MTATATATATDQDTTPDAALYTAITGSMWFTSPEYAPAVAIGNPADECPYCGTYTAGGPCTGCWVETDCCGQLRDPEETMTSDVYGVTTCCKGMGCDQ